MRSLLARRLGALMVALVGVAGCSDGTSPAGSGKLTLLLKDAPGDVASAVVTISEVNIQSENGTVNLSTTPFTVDLKTLVTDPTPLVQGLTVPAGTYSQLRLVISGTYIKLENGEIYSSPNYAPPAPFTLDPSSVTGHLQMPSLGQSGLKITLPGGGVTVPDGGDYSLLLDFDVSQSFGHQAGASGNWVMHPVIKATDATVSGSVAVTLALNLGTDGQGNPITLPGSLTLKNFADSVIVNGSHGGVTDNGDGTFTILFTYLAAGNYPLDILKPVGITNLSTTVDPLPTTVTVTSGATAAESITITVAN